METLIEPSQGAATKIKAHIDSEALKSLCSFIEERLDNYQPSVIQPNKIHPTESVRYGVFVDLEIDKQDNSSDNQIVDKITKFQVQKKIVLEEYWDKGIEPLGVIPNSIFKEVMLRFGLYRFEHLDAEGCTHTSPHQIINRPDGFKSKTPLSGLSANIKIEMFLIKTIFVLGIFTLVADFYVAAMVLKNSFAIDGAIPLFGLNMVLVVAHLAVNNLIHRKMPHVPLKAMYCFVFDNISFVLICFASILLIEVLVFEKVGFFYLFFLAIGGYLTISNELKVLYNPYYSEELKGKMNSLIMPDGCDSAVGEKISVNLLVHPPNEVKKMLKKIYPLPYSLAAESGAFKLTGSVVQKVVNLLDEVRNEVGTTTKGFIERWNDKVAQEDPIIYCVHKKLDVVVILAQYGNLKREKEAMEYIQSLSDNDIYLMM